MILKKAIFATLAFTTILGCTSSTPSHNRTVSLNNINVTWTDFHKVSPTIRESFPMPDGQRIYAFFIGHANTVTVTLSDGSVVSSKDGPSKCLRKTRKTSTGFDTTLYLECENKFNAAWQEVARKEPKLNLSQRVALAEQAVNSQGDCEWLGFNLQFDQQVRARTGAIPASDLNAIFVPLKCN